MTAWYGFLGISPSGQVGHVRNARRKGREGPQVIVTLLLSGVEPKTLTTCGGSFFWSG